MTNSPETCLLCPLPATVPCGTCQIPLYCTHHVSSDESHALLCSSLVSPPPADEDINSVLAVHLPSSSPIPKLVRIPITSFSDDTSGISFSEPSIYSLFPEDASPEAMHRERNRVRDRDTRSMLEVWSCKEGDGNQCLAALAGGEDKLFHPWKGEVVVLAMTRSRGGMVDPGTYQDVDAVDWRDVVDVVVDWGDGRWERGIKEVLDRLGEAKPEATNVDEGRTVEDGNPEDGEEVKANVTMEME
ncbi:hypothetical protein OQA88_12570 [Cercophora sp. LCS_1]